MTLILRCIHKLHQRLLTAKFSNRFLTKKEKLKMFVTVIFKFTKSLANKPNIWLWFWKECPISTVENIQVLEIKIFGLESRIGDIGL